MPFAALVMSLRPGRIATANAAGYVSIVCWLCAQFPQVIKNISLQSGEGLALPFLLNWMFGDVTNLIGCVLTQQLPFQTYLAAYFCVVDFTLLAQFFYCRSLARPPPSTSPYHVAHNYTNQSLILPPPQVLSPGPRLRSASNPALFPQPSDPSSSSHQSRSHHTAPSHIHPSTSITPANPDVKITSAPDGSYAAIFVAALDVARAAERVSRRRRSKSGGRRLSRQAPLAGIPDIDETLQGMVDSFHSEMSTQTASTLDDRRHMSQSVGTLPDRRGRTLLRSTGITPIHSEEADHSQQLQDEGGHDMVEEQVREARQGKSRSLSSVRGPEPRVRGRRAAGVAFMSLGLLVGWSGFTGRPARSRGMVLSSRPVSNSMWSSQIPTRSMRLTAPMAPLSTYMLVDDHPSPGPSPSVQRVIGRISAWTCTTLYLTSRLPQIWMNFTRRSVEGLSILLFVFAFCGNLFYVLSIMLNPAGDADPSEAGYYLLEALPYLLGSGGTLIFDLTIMLQSIVYGAAPPLSATPLDRSSRRHHGLARRRLRYPEEGHDETAERQPLLSGSIQLERSLSPDTSMRGSHTPRQYSVRRPSSEAPGMVVNQESSGKSDTSL